MSKVPDKLVETTTEQAPSILNNNYIKIGGAVVAFFIFFIILYFSFRSTPVKVDEETNVYNKCELFPRCYFISNPLKDEEINQLINKYPSLNIIKDEGRPDMVTITDSDNIQLNYTIIRSIKSEGYNLILFSLPNFTGTPTKMTGKINLECIEQPFRSVIINRIK
jgi:hypothetical protein